MSRLAVQRFALFVLVAGSGGVAACDRAPDSTVPPAADVAANGLHPLVFAAFRGDTAAIERLVAAGAEPDLRSLHGVTPLVAAVRGGHEAAVRLLLGRGASTDLRLRGGGTALSVAVDEGNLELVAVLLEAGANPQVRDGYGQRPVHVALARGDAELLALLGRHGGVREELESPFDGAAIDVVGFVPPAPAESTDDPQPVGIAFDRAGDRVYWAEHGAGRIRRARADGTRIETVVAADALGVVGVATDPRGAWLYWTTDFAYPRRVVGMDLQAGTTKTLAFGPLVNRPRAIAATDEAVYWTEAVNGRVRRRLVAAEIPEDVHVDGVSSWRETGSHVPLVALGLAVDPERRRLVWSDALGAAIVAAPLDGDEPPVILLDARQGVDFPVGVAVDPASGDICWSDVGREAIVCAAPTTGATRVVADAGDGVIEPRGIALDAGGGWLYWTDPSRAALGRARLAGGGVEWLDLADPAANGFAALPPPAECTAAVSDAAGSFVLRAVKRAAVCLEKVDAVKAVKRAAGDARRAASTCIGQLAGVHRDAPDSLDAVLARLESTACRGRVPSPHAIARGCGSEPCADRHCAVAACRARAWQMVHARLPRAAEWIDEVQPFVVDTARGTAATGTSPADRAARVLAEIRVAVSPPRATAPNGQGGLPRSGAMSSYRARRAAGDAPVPVADDGTVRTGAPMRFVDNRDGTITDAVTGLMWEKKCDACGGLHDVDARFARNEGEPAGRVDAWLAALNDTQGRGFAGYADWRLPNVHELVALLDFERFNPAVGAAFDGALCGLRCSEPGDPECSCTALQPYWTATPLAGMPENFLAVHFGLGLVGDYEGSERLPVRAVRGGRAPAAGGEPQRGSTQ